MVTLEALCAEMTKDGRSLTPRGARDWWTKGILPKPSRQGLGRGKGTLTFWPDGRIVAQAKAAYDALAHHGRTETTLVRLWLLGFEIDAMALRPAWISLIDKSSPWLRRRKDENILPADAIGPIAALAARAAVPDRGEIRQHMETLWIEGLNVFYATGDEIEIQDLGVAAVMSLRQSRAAEGLPPIDPLLKISDEDVASLLGLLREWLSLPAQRDTIARATEHELIRARRLWHIMLGGWCRPSVGVVDLDQWPCAVVFGRPGLPILLRLLRQPFAAQTIRTILWISREMKKGRPRRERVHAGNGDEAGHGGISR
jgi:hypothetical protein